MRLAAGETRALVACGHARAAGEPLGAWASRVRPRLDAGLQARFEQALRLHLRYRFDPIGLDAPDRRALRDAASELVRSMAATGGARTGAGT